MSKRSDKIKNNDRIICYDDDDDKLVNYNNINNNVQQQRKLFRITDSRTATIHTTNGRKKPVFSQVLMTAQNNNDRSWPNHPQQQQQQRLSESETITADRLISEDCVQFPKPLSAMNNVDLKDVVDHHNGVDEQQQQDKITTKSGSQPMMARNLPYRVLYRIQPTTLNNNNNPNNIYGLNNNRRKMHTNGLNSFNYMPPSNLIRLFGESSVPGVRDIALSQSFVRRMFWICSFFFFGFLALRDISQLVSEYYTYPITVDVRLRDSRRLQFPAVTVCNLNIVRYSALCMSNSSVIKDSMIPRDLREKLCGIQPPLAAAAAAAAAATTTSDSSLISTTTPPSASTGATTGKLITTAQPTIRTTKSKSRGGGGGHHSSSSNRTPKTSTKTLIRTTTMSTTTPLPTNSDTNDGMDDINTYGVASNFSDTGLNDTLSLNGTDINDIDSNMTAESSSSSSSSSSSTTITTATTITTMKPLVDDIPNDIAGPIDIQLDRPKRKVSKTNTDNSDKNNNNNNSTNDKDGNNQSGNNNNNQKQSSSSATTKEPPAYFDNIELTEREEKELQENLTNWLAVIYNSNEKIAKQIGHQFEDLILRCTIRSTNCAHANSFEHFFTPTEGNCFTFKSQNLRKTNLERIKDETSIAGVNYGLELVLNLEISEYLIGTAQIGAIVMIQHPDEIGNSASEAIFVAPKQSTYIGMKMVNISRLPKPFPEECIDHWPAGLVGRLTQNASYSQQACLKICLQRTIHTRCQCQSAQLPQLELNSTLKICDTRRKVTRNCVEEVMFQAEEKVSTCKCPPRCQVINYDKTVSMTKWPTREDRVTFDRGKVDMNFQNLAKVTVYFQTMTCQEVRQEKAYTTAKLFSSLGGILGMYVGFSFLSLFEILEIFGRRFWYIVTKKNVRFRAAVHAITATFAMKRRKKQRKVNNFNNNEKNRNGSLNQRKK